MKVKDIYNKVKTYWPEEIDFSDFERTSETGYKSENLSKAWDHAELKTNDEFEDKMVWTMYKILHEQMLTVKNSKLLPRNLDLELLKTEYRTVMIEAGLKSMLSKLDY